jgi:hypothetical protein
MNGRPLIITDCDEVLLHMIAHFRDWLAETQGVEFRWEGGDFARSMRRSAGGEPLPAEEMWRLLGLFFDTEMHRQTPVAGAVEAIGALAERADVVVLTNLADHRRDMRAAQLARLGINLAIHTNQGPKGPAIRAIVRAHGPRRAFFIDDIAQHHQSAALEVPAIVRLHFCGEPQVAPHIACAHEAGHAHARIDRWDAALPWLLERLEEDA